MADGKGFKIATAYVSVEARVDEAAATRARSNLTGGTRPSTAAPSATTPATRQPPTTVGPLGSQIAGARANLVRTGTEAAKTLEQGFKQGLSSLSNMAVRQLKSLSDAARQTPRIQTPAQTPGAAAPTGVGPVRNTPATPVAPIPGANIGRDIQAQNQQQIAQRQAALRMAQQQQTQGQMQGQRAAAQRPIAGSGPVTNTFNTKVQIEPRFVQELLDVVKQVNQLKATNRATRR